MKVELNGLGVILFIVFLVLKLMHIIAWSWWWVTAPLWLPIVLSLMLVFLLEFYMDKRI